MIIPSLSCPASCSYCFGPNDGPVMDVLAAQKTVAFIAKAAEDTKQQKISVTLHGGEPLAAGYDVIRTIVSGIRRIDPDASVSAQSNLWLLDEAYCELFREYSVALGTSLDGPEELNDAQRGKGYFGKTMEGIRLAEAYGLQVNCIVTFTNSLIPHWRRVCDFFIENNLHFSVHPSLPSVSGRNGMEISPAQYRDLLKEMFAYYIPRANEIMITVFDQICRGVASGVGMVCSFCDCLGMFLAIDPAGYIYPCQRFAGQREYSLGAINEYIDIWQLMNSPVAKTFAAREKAIEQQCGECTHYSYCKGGCTYNALAAKRSNEVDPYCKAYRDIFAFVKERIREDMVSEANEKAIAQFGPNEDGPPLLRRGKVIDLTKLHIHPYSLMRTARRIVAAYELAMCGDIETTAKRLVTLGVSKTLESAKNSLEAMIGQMKADPGLGKLYLHITSNCQLQCSHCYASFEVLSEMNAAQVIALAREAKRSGFREVVFTGGEPLMLEELDVLLEGLTALKREEEMLPFVLRTNFVRKMFDGGYRRIAQAFDEIVVSIDGTEREHDLRRGKETYQKTVENIKAYINAVKADLNTNRVSAKIVLSASLTSEDMNGVAGESVKQLGKELNVERVKFRPLLPLGRALGQPLKAQPLYAYMSEIDIFERGFMPKTTCGIGQNLYVEPSGDAYPCYAYHQPHALLGNVIQEGLEHVIQSEQFTSLKRHDVNSNKGCRQCNFKYLCGGACRAWSGETAQYDLDASPDECCALMQRAETMYKIALDYLAQY